MFGQKAGQYVEQLPILEDGEYVGTIVRIEPKMVKGFSILEVEIAADGNIAAIPRKFTLFDPDEARTEEEMQRSNARMSLLIDAAGAQLTPDGLNYAPAIGKKVKFIVRTNKKGYKDIVTIGKLQTLQQDLTFSQS